MSQLRLKRKTWYEDTEGRRVFISRRNSCTDKVSKNQPWIGSIVSEDSTRLYDNQGRSFSAHGCNLVKECHFSVPPKRT